ncbi:DMT family transporter [Nereida sp. MMG025]|uniref:DMT family transporter n=1 Tax=Nereida sp. MMG025 TaxID=2909981 RepID=UPI001F3829F1|nr:DMT family transporter [Nereida sp. MMG025]MCF6444005.1 DMT family transporter [Nereida sp. MMG025]
MNQNLPAIGFMITGMAILGVIDNFIVYISDEISLWQFHTVRSTIAVGFVWAVALWRGWIMWPKRIGWVVARNVFFTAAMILYFGSLGFFPLPVVAAGLFTAPVLMVFINAIWSREKIGHVRLIAALCGFAGCLLVLKPDVGAFGWENLIPMSAGVCYAIGNLATRKWCEGESALSLLWTYMTMIGVVAALVSVYFQMNAGDTYLSRAWVWPSAQTWWILIAQALVSLVGIGLIMQAYLIGEATYVSVFEYTLLIFASITTYVMFGTILGPLGLLGIALIIVTGAVIALRSRAAQVPA